MRRALALGFVFLFLFSHVACAEQATKPEVWYFFENYCDACHPEEEFRQTFLQLTGDNLMDYDYRYFNIRTGLGKAALDAAIERFHIDKAHQLFPLAIVDGKVYAGSTAINAALPGDWLEKEPSTDSLIYFLYVPSCESCEQAESALEKLPKELTISRGSVSFSSKVVVERINLSTNLAAAQALFEKYNVPEDKRMAPIAFVRDRYYQGSDAIGRYLLFKVKSGGAVGVDPIAAGATDLSAVSLWGSVAAGLVGGLNPCALSMLLMFLAMIIAAGRSVRKYAAAFLISKFVVYLLIGTGLYGLMGLYNPEWIRPVLRWAMTVLGVGLATLNVVDAIHARREQYGKIKNQLPTSLRKRLNERISHALTAPGARLLPVVVLLGVLVAAGEFLCAGQVYLAALMAAVQSGMEPIRMGLMLLIYCVSFIAPSALIGILAARGRAVFELSEWVRGHMPAIKLITAATLLAIVALMWVAAIWI